MEQTCSINIIGVLGSSVLEGTGLSSGVDDKTLLEHEEEMIRFLVLDHPHLNRGTAILVIQTDSVESSSSLLILRGLLYMHAGRGVGLILRAIEYSI